MLHEVTGDIPADRCRSRSPLPFFHQPQTHTNRLTGPLRDPQSNCPDYKVIAVRLNVPADPVAS
jgi:predicted molibdopterin-dependent oxidoreductase YjgC